MFGDAASLQEEVVDSRSQWKNELWQLVVGQARVEPVIGQACRRKQVRQLMTRKGERAQLRASLGLPFAP